MKRFIVFLFLLWCGSLAAQTRITLTDAVTGAPVPYANILYGDQQGKYADEAGTVVIPAGVETALVSHISYQSLTLDLARLGGPEVRLTPVATMLAPAVIQPKGAGRMKLGHANGKRLSVQGGRNGYQLAELFPLPQGGNGRPLITRVQLNLNPFNLHKVSSTRIGDTSYDDCVTYVAKLRVDLRAVDPASGGPGASLIGGGVILTLQDKFDLTVHRIYSVDLPQPLLFPEEGVFAAVEWIVTEDVRIQDSVTPSLWSVAAEDPASSWVKWPLGTPWRPLNAPGAATPRSFAISLVTTK
ncbi:MAG: hypothetical protein J6W98_00010 [Bacteroidales bacterium]|nr:hypothetical protein [Bacteroidales bacterium]